MALGVPCISTDCPSGPAEILGGGEYGILVPVRDPQALANQMHRLTTDESHRQQLSAKSLARAEDFSARRMAGEYRNLIVAELKSLRSSE
jgi:glycosyltransferase involved in cell wall biosynthesis